MRFSTRLGIDTFGSFVIFTRSEYNYEDVSGGFCVIQTLG